MTEESPVASRYLFTPETEYDTVRVHIRSPTSLGHTAMEMFLDGTRTGLLTSHRGTLVELVDQHVEAGDVTVEWITPVGTFADADIPEWLRPYVNLRSPFIRQVSTPLTQVEQRREEVTNWAVENTSAQILAKSMTLHKIARTAAVLDGRRRHIGQIWWAYVLHILAAAQHDPWLEDTNIWPAIERALEIDGHEFLDGASATEWNEAAGYMEAYSRVYQAHPTYVASAPIHVRLVQTPTVQQLLTPGAVAARRIVYGGGD